MLPSKCLDFPCVSLPVKITFSKKITSSTVLGRLGSDDRTISTSDDYRDPRSEKPSNKKEVMAGTLNLIKAMAGTGILALPMGVAKTSDFRTSILPAIAVMSILGAISAYTFSLYGRLVHTSQAKSLGELWEKKMSKNSGRLLYAGLPFTGCCISVKKNDCQSQPFLFHLNTQTRNGVMH